LSRNSFKRRATSLQLERKKMDWSLLVNIAEAIAYSISVLGVCGLGWYIAGIVTDKLLHREE